MYAYFQCCAPALCKALCKLILEGGCGNTGTDEVVYLLGFGLIKDMIYA